MWTITVAAERMVAVMAQHPKAIRPIVLLQPSLQGSVDHSAMGASAAVDVINRHKFVAALSAARAFAAVMGQYLKAQLDPRAHSRYRVLRVVFLLGAFLFWCPALIGRALHQAITWKAIARGREAVRRILAVTSHAATKCYALHELRALARAAAEQASPARHLFSAEGADRVGADASRHGYGILPGSELPMLNFTT